MGTAAETGTEESLLIERSRKGDTSAFSVLVRLHRERAVHMALSFVGNMEEAKDIAQDAFVKAYQHLHSYRGDSRFSTWLYRILANTCKDHLRKRSLRQTVLQFFGQNDEENFAQDFDSLPSRAPGAYTQLANKELGAALQKAVNRLPLKQKTIFILRYYEGFSLNEISEMEKITTGAVKAHLWQAAQKMKKELKEYGIGEAIS